jgi:[protein-PII] uridylyltransferase
VTSVADALATRRRIADVDADLARRFWAGADIDGLIAERTRFIDETIVALWNGIDWPASALPQLALFAVGGYGRGELHPCSDIDLLIVCDGDPAACQRGIERFVQRLWDLKLDIGHSVRTIEQCREVAERDITIATALLERRPLAGPRALDRRLGDFFARDDLWPSAKFFRAKRAEQIQRHRRFADTEYNLEPNIKSSPGGLRDIQTVGWIIKRHFGSLGWNELSGRGFLTPDEAALLTEGRRFLWRVRWGLHLIAKRKEDRLLFDYQRTLAERFGYVDGHAQLGVEQFMHDYYRLVLGLREVNDMLLQHFDEAILRAHYTPDIEPINERFQIRDSYIEACHQGVFADHPPALMEMFVIMANRRDIAGVRSSTIRLVRDHLDLIDERFRNDATVTALFIDLLRAPYTLVSQLTRMRRYGVLGRYIPEFGRVIGQMQHDLFHIYTVDAHTMMVIRNMRQFHYRSAEETFPVAYHCVKNLPKIELLYIAGLFHDIGKGRGGDHSTLGAEDVAAFCRRHRLSDADTELVTWLVRDHLVMSSTAQRKDINDPEIIHEFAQIVRNQLRLDYLYALTVADITATNPTLWNGWRATLLRQLYSATRKALRRGLEAPVNRDQLIDEITRSALERLAERGLTRDQVLAIWDNPDPEFFLQHAPNQIVAITEAIAAHDLAEGPLVMLRDTVGLVSDERATEIFIYTRDQPNLFAATTIAIDQLELSIHDARIFTSANGMCFNSYFVLDHTGRSIGENTARCEHIRRTLVRQLKRPQLSLETTQRRIPRRLRQFQRPTRATLANEPDAPFTTLQIEASDRPGLLARLGQIFVELGITVYQAKVSTLGDRVEDIFWIADRSQAPITDPAQIAELSRIIGERLDLDIADDV